jgi:hypothetical protein
VPRLDAVAGRPTELLIDLNPAIAERIAAGERFDVGLTNPHFVPALVASGRIAEASHRPFGRVPLAIGRRKGSAPSLATGVEDIVALIGAAESIGYTGAGTSGHTYLDVVERLGLSQTALPKSRPLDAGRPIAAVAAGEVELCVVPLTTVRSAPGVVPAAIFPSELGADIDLSVFLSPTPAEGASAILEFLTSSEIDPDFEGAGLIRFAFQADGSRVAEPGRRD